MCWCVIAHCGHDCCCCFMIDCCSDTLVNVDARNVSGVSIFNTSAIEQVNEEKESGVADFRDAGRNHVNV